MRKFARIISALLLTVMLLALAGCGSAEPSNDPKVGTWKATVASMSGISIPVEAAFEGGMSFELKDKGKCTLYVGEEKATGKWSFENDVLSLSAGGVDLSGEIVEGVFNADNVLDSGIILSFEKEGGYTG